MHRVSTSPAQDWSKYEMGRRHELPTLTETGALTNHSQKKIVPPRQSHGVHKASAHKHVCEYREVNEAGQT